MNLEIDCIKRLLKVNSASELIGFMIDEKIIKKDLYIDAHDDKAIATTTYLALQQALLEEKVMLADFEWVILPKELIKITIVTPDTHKEFSFGL